MSLYVFQQDVFEAISRGKSVILQAPTGSGKTQAALAPFLYALAEAKPSDFPRKCIYSVPMRVLANQFVATYEKHMEVFIDRRRIYPPPQVSIQTGERPDDRKFEDNLIFATIDQTLASSLSMPYGLSSREANLNVGAVIGSYLVFDEFHLFGSRTALPTTLAILRILKGITPFILMTATFSRAMLEGLAKELDATIIPPLDADLSTYFADTPAQPGKRTRFWHWIDTGLQVEHVVEHLAHKIICICNTVDRARTLVADLRRHPALHEYEITLLHSQFFQVDRDRKENVIRSAFKNADTSGKPQILVATQVIEVGLDISCHVLHTELAPANSLLQRAGRCARREGEEGQVFVYQTENDAPYVLDEKSRQNKEEAAQNRHLMQATREALTSGDFTGRPLNFMDEQALIERVHTPVDQDIVQQIRQTAIQRTQDIFACMCDPKAGRGAISTLIRDADSGYVIIHDDPNADKDLLKNPWHYQGLSLRPGTIYRAWKELLELENSEEGLPFELPWIAQQAVDTKLSIQEERSNEPRYIWQKLETPDELFGGIIALALHPAFAAYTQDDGLLLGHIGNCAAPTLVPRQRGRAADFEGYERESYAEHVQGLQLAYTREVKFRSGVLRPPLRDEYAYPLQKIAQRCGVEALFLDELIRLLFALHDVGKMSEGWQRFAHEWQKLVGARFYQGADRSLPAAFMAAHTDYDGSEEQRKANHQHAKKFPKPNHAGESAVASLPLLVHFVGGKENAHLFQPAISAIAHHHTPTIDVTTQYDFTLSPYAPQALAEALDAVGLPALSSLIQDKIRWQVSGRNLKEAFTPIDPQYQQETLLYFFLVRLLRLADQRSGRARTSAV